jgi:hypothetical protein
MRRRLALLAVPAVAFAAPVHADRQARVIAVVSLVADVLTVTGFESTTGSLLNVNPIERIELRDDGLERSVLRAAVRAINESKAGRPVPLMINDGALYRSQDRILSDDTARIPPSLLDPLRSQQATHLLLVTKHQAAARMNTGTVQVGSGRVEGLGFYIDRVTPLRSLDSGETSVGYLAPHVFVRLSLIDLADSRVLRSRAVTASRVIFARNSDRGADPWELLDSAGKIKAIDELITSDCAPALRELLVT